MTKAKMRIVSAITSIALLGATAASFAAMAPLAQASTPTVTTGAATGVSTSGATLNGTNGSTDATGSAFWVSTSSASLSGLASSSSPTLSANTYSTGDLGAVASSTSFSAPLSSLTIPSGFSVTAGATYYYVAWVDVGGVWYPGSVGTVTLPTTSTTTTISNVNVSNVGTTSVTISWNTNNACTGTVNYGTTSSYGSSVNTTGSASTTQSVTINNLTQGTMYHFGITANCATTSSSDMTFITQSTSSSTPLAVTGVDAIRTSGIADNTFGDGWEWVMHLTVPDNEDAFHIKFSDWAMTGNASTTFPANSNIEVYSAQSSNAATLGSAVSSSGNGYSGWLYLNGDTSSTTPGRQIDLHIVVKIPTGTAAGSYSTTYTAQSWPSTSTSTAPTI